jgi:hypothetical protein
MHLGVIAITRITSWTFEWHHREVERLLLRGNPADRPSCAQTQTKVTSRLSRVATISLPKDL